MEKVLLYIMGQLKLDRKHHGSKLPSNLPSKHAIALATPKSGRMIQAVSRSSDPAHELGGCTPCVNRNEMFVGRFDENPAPELCRLVA